MIRASLMLLGQRGGRPDHEGLFGAVAVVWVGVTAAQLGDGIHRHQSPALLVWTGMTVTMMLPTLYPRLRHLAWSSLRSRRAVWLFLAGYLTAWTGYGVAVLAGYTMVARLAAGRGWLDGHGTLPVAGALLLAAGWQLTPAKRMRLRGCRAGWTLPAHGWRADRAAYALGLRDGTACVGVCWAMMLVMLLATVTGGTVPHLALMLVFLAVVWAEKVQGRARELALPTAATFAALAVALALLSA